MYIVHVWTNMKRKEGVDLGVVAFTPGEAIDLALPYTRTFFEVPNNVSLLPQAEPFHPKPGVPMPNQQITVLDASNMPKFG